MKFDFIKCACIVVSALGAAVGLYIFMRYLFPAVLPFMVAYIIAWVATSLAKRVTRGKGTRHAANITVTFLILAGTIAAASFGIYRMGAEVVDFASALNSESGRAMISDIELEINTLISEIPILSERVSDGGDMINRFLNGITTALGEEIPALVGRILSSAPKIMLSFIVAVIASFYLSYDFDGVNSALKTVLPKGMREGASRLKTAVAKLFRGYAKAYAMLMLIVFAMLTVGLLIGGVKYAFLFAALISFLDVLPAIGVGAVLVPWGLVSLWQGNMRLGASLLVTYAVVTVVRQLCESRLVGTHIGVPPLLALFCMFVGFSLFGFVGILLGAAVGAVVSRFILPEKNAREDPLPNELPH